MRPDLPKEMANRIYAAQKKVLNQRDRIEHAEDRIREDTEEIEFYERDPRGWADKLYGSRCTLDSYPVITRSTRIRDALERGMVRRPLRALDLRNAERRLCLLEEDIMVRVSAMRPTGGRVPWPPALPIFAGYDQILDTRDEAVALANAYMTKEADLDAERLLQLNDDGATPGDGSEEALAARRAKWSRPVHLDHGTLKIAEGACFRVTAFSHDCVKAMQDVIDEDHSSGVVGDLWNLACGFFLTGCDWIGFRDWRDTVIANVERTSSYHAYAAPGVSLETIGLNANARYDGVLSALEGHYLPEDVIDVQSFAFGSAVVPSALYAFWKGAGFSEAVAKNWFLKSQPHTHIFRASDNSFGYETWQSMRHANLALEGSEIPLTRGIHEFNLRELRSAMEILGLKPFRFVTECRSSLLDHPDPETVKAALGPSGYLQLQAVNPPLSLDWDEFQSWRMQIRGMSGVLTDLYLDVPQLKPEQRAILLQ